LISYARNIEHTEQLGYVWHQLHFGHSTKFLVGPSPPDCDNSTPLSSVGAYQWVPDVSYLNLFITRLFVPGVLKEG